MSSYFIVGGAGFIGSHFVGRLLSDAAQRVTVYDNFSSGSRWHLRAHLENPRLKVVEGDAGDLPRMTEAMQGHEVVIHLASNPDIAKAATDPDIDFREGTNLTRNVGEAVRLSGVARVLYASGSGVYGDLGEYEVPEDHGPLIPVSTYGASKLAGEALLCSYAYMFDRRVRVFRFGNVVGGAQTHGVAYDFLNRLRQEPARLSILGDGLQSKSYIHVEDVISAVLLADRSGEARYDAFNVATGDYITVRQIADIVCQELGLTGVEYVYSGGSRGWKGDVPVVRLNTDKIQTLGWRPEKNCAQAIRASVQSMIGEKRATV